MGLRTKSWYKRAQQQIKDRSEAQKKKPEGTLTLGTQQSLRASEHPVGATQQSYAKMYDVIEDQN